MLQPGRGGLARQGESAGEAYWLENLVWDRDGVARPRYGLKHIKTFTGAVTHMSRPGGYNHKLMVIADSGTLYALDVESPASPTTVATGWPQVPLSSCIGVKTTGATVWCACKQGTSQSDGSFNGSFNYWDGSTLTSVSAAGVGNHVSNHNNLIFRVASGDYNTAAPLQWSNLGDVATWQSVNAKVIMPGIQTMDYTVPFSETETVVFGAGGIGIISGTSQNNLVFRASYNIPAATPMNHIVKARDRIFFLAAGPAIYEIIPPGTPRRIDPPMFRDLFDFNGAYTYARAWYDPVRNYYCLADRYNHYVYCYSIDQGAWVGVWTYTTTSTDLLGQAYIDQAASSVDATTQPWGKGFIAAGVNLLQWDPSVATDATSSSTTAAFTCAVETQIDRARSMVERQLQSVRVYPASTTWTVKLRHRISPGASWTTITLGTTDSDGLCYPSLSNMPVYREAVVRLEASSATALRFHSLEMYETDAGVPA